MLRAPLLSALVVASSAAACAPKPTPATSTAADHHHALHLPPVGPTIRVTFEGTDIDVPLDPLPAEGSDVRLLSIVKRAFPNTDTTTLHLDLFGSDGFHPSDRPKCSAPLTPAQLAAARVALSSHDVAYDDSATLPGCYRVRALVRILASR